MFDGKSQFSENQTVNATSVVSTDVYDFKRSGREISLGTPLRIALYITETITTNKIKVIAEGSDASDFSSGVVSQDLHEFANNVVQGTDDAYVSVPLTPGAEVFNKRYLRLKYTKATAAGNGKISSGFELIPGNFYRPKKVGWKIAGGANE